MREARLRADSRLTRLHLPGQPREGWAESDQHTEVGHLDQESADDDSPARAWVVSSQRSNSPCAAATVKADHSDAVNISAGPEGFFESRTPTRSFERNA